MAPIRPPSLRVLLAKPSRFIHLPVQFLIIDGKEIIREAIGILGWLSVSLGQWAYDGWYIALGMAALGILASGGARRFPGEPRMRSSCWRW